MIVPSWIPGSSSEGSAVTRNPPSSVPEAGETESHLPLGRALHLKGPFPALKILMIWGSGAEPFRPAVNLMRLGLTRISHMGDLRSCRPPAPISAVGTQSANTMTKKAALPRFLDVTDLISPEAFADELQSVRDPALKPRSAATNANALRYVTQSPDFLWGP